MFTAVWLEQIVMAVPVEAVGVLVIVNALVEIALVQPVSAVAVRVSVTPPLVMSVALGVYVHPVSELAFVSVPAVPLEVQATLTAFAALAPVVISTPVCVEQIDMAVPASTVAAFTKEIVFVLVISEQGEFA